MDGVRFSADADFAGSGISYGLARGLQVWAGPDNLTGEGMGIGTVAIRTKDGTFFSQSAAGNSENSSHFTRTFAVDTKMSWGICGTASPLLTRLAEHAIGLYMQHPHLQRYFMAIVPPLRKITGINPVFEKISPCAEVAFTYTIERIAVDVAVRITAGTDLVGTLCILNELSADAFSAGWVDGRTDLPPGWQALPDEMHLPSLYDPVHEIRFSIADIAGIQPAAMQLFWGREKAEDLCWAGFCIELRLCKGSPIPSEIRYRIVLTEGIQQ
jgi:hypothetical protein